MGFSGKVVLLLMHGTPAMTETLKGFLSRLKRVFSSVDSSECFMHRVQMANTFPTELVQTWTTWMTSSPI